MHAEGIEIEATPIEVTMIVRQFGSTFEWRRAEWLMWFYLEMYGPGCLTWVTWPA